MATLAPIDDDRIAALLVALGRDRLLGLMDTLKAELAALDANDSRLLEAVHRLRGSSGSLGLPALADALLRLETTIAADRPGIAGAIAALESLRAEGVAAVTSATPARDHVAGARKQ